MLAALALAGCGTRSGHLVRPATFGGFGRQGGTSGVGAMHHLPIHTGWGPTRREIGTAREYVDHLSLAERAGQVILARYKGTAAPVALVHRLHLGGVVVFANNYAGVDRIRASNRRLQHAIAAAGRRWPVLIGVDQEGGLVERITGGTRFPAFMTAGAAGRPQLTRRAAAASGAELAGLGFNVDFAPDADVTSGPLDPTIGSRSAGSDPSVVAQQSVAAMHGYASVGMIPVVKHFPGHGSVAANSHYTLPVQTKTLAELAHDDLVPFQNAIDAGAPVVMVAHLDVRAVDPGTPSSLSRRVVTGLLRHRFGFGGVASTDATDMAAITGHTHGVNPAVQALRAGEDIVLMPPRPARARASIVRAVEDGGLDQARLDQAATRVVALMLHHKHGRVTARPPGKGRAVSHALSAAGITEVQGSCGGRLVGSAVRVQGSRSAVATFRGAAREEGLRVLRKHQPGWRKASTVALVGYGRPAPSKRADVLVATDTPYVLGRARGGVKIATYGRTPGAMRALVDVLLGKAPAPGHLPVQVAHVPRTGC